MLLPKKTKHRKSFKAKLRVRAKGGCVLNFGDYGLKACESCLLTSRQIEAARKCIARSIKRVGRVWIRIFPDTPVSKKPPDVRMGKGKGSVEFWVFPVGPGRVLFEISGDVSRDLAEIAMLKAAAKLPLKCRFISSEDVTL